MRVQGPPAAMTRPRVLHVTTAHRADDVRVFERECRSLAASGRYDVFLAASGRVPSASGVTLIPLSAAPTRRVGRFVSGPRKASALCRFVAADLWHFHDPELLPVALRLARSGHQVIWDAHEDYLAQFTPDGDKSWVPARARRPVRAALGVLLNQIDRHAAGIVAATSTIASQYSNPSIAVVGNEANLEHFAHCRPDPTSQQILFTGIVGSGHLFLEVVDAVAGVPDATLVVAGREPPADLWATAEARLGGRLSHAGWLDRRGLATAAGSSAIGLVTYADTPAYADASPTKAFEFAAAGLPVVATPNATNVRTLANSGAGWKADDFSAAAIRRAILTALADPAAWQAASASGRAWAAREGSWAGSERRLLDLYATLLRGSPSSGRSTRK